MSVVVATYNRPARLAALLESLRDQTLPSDAFEVVVVDNGSAAATQELLDAASAAGGLQLRVVRHTSTRGPAGARNAGWPLAAAPLVAFTDDDCSADARLVERCAGGARRRILASVIQGRTEPNPSELDAQGLFSRTVRVERLGPQYETCNVFYPRAALESLGGFVESFDPSREARTPTLPGAPSRPAGDTVFAPEARVFHAVERIGPAAAACASRPAGHRPSGCSPSTRERVRCCTTGVFWNVWHYLLWRSLLALAGPAVASPAVARRAT